MDLITFVRMCHISLFVPPLHSSLCVCVGNNNLCGLALVFEFFVAGSYKGPFDIVECADILIRIGSLHVLTLTILLPLLHKNQSMLVYLGRRLNIAVRFLLLQCLQLLNMHLLM